MFELHRRNPTAVRHRCAQRGESENEHSPVTAMVRIVILQLTVTALGHQWL